MLRGPVWICQDIVDLACCNIQPTFLNSTASMTLPGAFYRDDTVEPGYGMPSLPLLAWHPGSHPDRSNDLVSRVSPVRRTF
jgi:hypothetical protein